MAHLGNILNGRYKLLNKIGEGGFAEVYLATDVLLARQVAVKVVSVELEDNREFLNRFQHEAQAIAVLDHLHILQIYDFGLTPTAYLVTPYLSGGTLAAYMRANKLTLDEIGYYLEQIGAALDYAHKHNIVHRDVKPQNVLLRADGKAVVADFGFAKIMAGAEMAAQSRLLGTPHYMAPEQFQGYVTAASDIYSLGVVLYQMLTQNLPFSGGNRQIMNGHLQENPPALASQLNMEKISPEVLARLDQVLLRVLAKDPKHRYPGGEALAHAFKAAIKPAKSGFSYDVEGTVRAPATPPEEQSDKTELYLNLPVAAKVAPPPGITVPPLPSKVETERNNPRAVPPAAPVMKQPPRLTIRTEPDQKVSFSFELKGENLTLGREVSNNLHVPLAIVSRHHCTLQRVGAVGPGMKYKIVDNKSLNKLFFNNQAVGEKILENGDVIRIGVPGYADYVVYLTYTAPVWGAAPSQAAPHKTTGDM